MCKKNKKIATNYSLKHKAACPGARRATSVVHTQTAKQKQQWAKISMQQSKNGVWEEASNIPRSSPWTWKLCVRQWLMDITRTEWMTEAMATAFNGWCQWGLICRTLRNDEDSEAKVGSDPKAHKWRDGKLMQLSFWTRSLIPRF